MKERIWSQGLQEQTRAAIAAKRFNPISGGLHFKHSEGEAGRITVANLLANRLIIKTVGGESIEFTDVDDLIGRGWVID